MAKGFGDDFRTFQNAFTVLKTLHPLLPNTVPIATKSHRIQEVFERIPVPKAPEERWQAFNRRLDALFGEDVRDANGRLLNLARGPLGLDAVVEYIESESDASTLLWDPATVKVDRLADEVRFLIRASGTSSVKQKDATKKTSASAKAKKASTDQAKDKDYRPPKRRRGASEEPVVHIFDSDGQEVESDTELGTELTKEREEAKSGVENETASVNDREPIKKTKRNTIPETTQHESGDESDGLSALRAVKEAEEKSHGSRRGPENQSMSHFHSPIPVLDGQNKRWEFKCKMCNKVRTVARTVVGKSITFDDEPKLPPLNNLASHAKECRDKHKARVEDAQEQDSTSSSDKFNLRRSREFMRQYLKNGELNPEIVASQSGESPTLALLFKYLKITMQLPSDTTVRNELAKIFAELHGKVVRELANVKSKISYSTDTWTTSQMVYTFACTIAHFIDDDWNLIERVVDFKPLEEKEHGGEQGGRAFFNSARERGGLDKIRSFIYSHALFLPSLCLHFQGVTTDNASVNDIIVQTAARLILERYGIALNSDAHIRCIAHVINLVVQAFLAAIEENPDPDVEDLYEFIKDFPIHYDVEKDEDQIALEEETLDVDTPYMPEPTDDDSDELSTIAGQSAVKRLRFIVSKITSSPQRRLLFRKLATKEYGKDSRESRLMVVKDVRTRWNYTHAMIERALLLRQAIDRWLFEIQEYRGVIQLTDSDWKSLKQIGDVLTPFTKHTHTASLSKTPTIPFVLPMYLSMETELLKVQHDLDSPLSIRSAAKKALEKLRKYKIIADGNQRYTVGTVLHPSFRAEWFRKTAMTAKGKEDAVAKAIAVVTHIAEAYLKDQPADSSFSLSSSSQVAMDIDEDDDDAMTVDIPEFSDERTAQDRLKDELKRYFRFEGGKCKRYESLAWWKANTAAFPILSRMARDFLAIPSTSVSVERTFSASRHICEDLRSSLRAETVKEALLSKVWIHAGLLSPNEPVRPRKKHGERSSL